MGNDVNNISVIEIQDVEELIYIKDDIKDFLDCPDVVSSPYHYPEFIESTVKYDTSILQWSVCVLKDADEIISIIPFYLRRQKFPIKFALFSLFSFKVNMLHFFGEGYSYRSDDDLPVIHKILNERLTSIKILISGL